MLKPSGVILFFIGTVLGLFCGVVGVVISLRMEINIVAISTVCGILGGLGALILSNLGSETDASERGYGFAIGFVCLETSIIVGIVGHYLF